MPFDKLKQATITAQTTGSGFKVAENQIKDEDYVNRFLFSGFDFKGQAQSCYTADGYAVSGSGSWEPTKLMGLGVGVEGSGRGVRLQQLMVLTQRHGPIVASQNNPLPLALYLLSGIMWDAKAGISAEFGIGASYSGSAFLDTGDASLQGKAPAFKADLPSTAPAAPKPPAAAAESSVEKATAMALEVASFKAEAKLAIKVDASVTFQHIYLEDPYSMHMPADDGGRKAIRTRLAKIFRDGLEETKVLDAAAKFVNHPSHNGFPELQKSTGFLGLGSAHWEPSALIQSLTTGIGKLEASPKGSLSLPQQQQLQEATSLRADLQRVVNQSRAGTVPCSLWLTSVHPEGSAGIYYKASASGSATAIAGLDLDVTLSGKVLTLELSMKYASYRYQCKVLEKPRIYMTQDTWICYKQVDFTWFSAELAGKVALSIAAPKVSAVQVGKTEATGASASIPLLSGKKDILKKKKIESDRLRHNSMTYGATVIYWESPFKRPVRQPHGKQARDVDILKGSGVCFGLSAEVTNLIDLIMSYDPVGEQWLGGSASSAQKYLATLAAALRIDQADMLKFFSDPATQPGLLSLLRDLDDAEIKTVLVETSFGLSGTAQITHEWSTANGFEDVHSLSSSLSNTIFKKVEALPAAKRSELLQCLRIRYRLKDVSDDDKTLFKLGFKLCGVGAKLQIDSVERAGSEGIVDLMTLWKITNVANPAPASIYNLEDTVPPVILFCQ